MARHWQDACVDAVAKLPPLRAPRFSGTIPRGASRLPPNRDATTGRLTTAHDWRRHGSRSQAGGILVGATVAVSWLPYGEARKSTRLNSSHGYTARAVTRFRETIPGSSFAPW